MWPPSSGSSGSRLKMPMKKFSAGEDQQEGLQAVALADLDGLAAEPAGADHADRACPGRARRR